ncbi:unnamed protein product [Phytomonas sp. EM1]|nr:unnamed protein product [Phytomonas sp. EM1]|eukprot:CCW64283.1 unnamed protein product [Phytomonas sp. isolate EM1]
MSTPNLAPQWPETKPTVAPTATPSALSLWDKLDLPSPDAVTLLHQSKRVVLLGNMFSGKRTLSSQLRRASELQYTLGEDSHHPTVNEETRRPLYVPAAASNADSPLIGADPREDSVVSMSSFSQSPCAMTATHGSDRLPHGSGLAHDYVIQRVPRRAASPSSGGGGSPQAGFIRQSVEFFCCDTAGALFSALPSLQSLEEAVVLLVIDVSRPGEIQAQLDSNYDALHAHVSKLLSTHLPNQDEVRRIQMIESQQQYWMRQEKRLRSLRAVLAAKGPLKEALVSPSVCLDEVNAESLRTPPDSVCPVRSILICTKTDRLERLSKTLESSPLPEELDAFLNHVVPASLRADMQSAQLSLLPLVAQLVRQRAIAHCSSLMAVSSRLSTAPMEGVCGADLAHPYYRGLWNHILERLMDDSIPAMGNTTAGSAELFAIETDHAVQENELESLCTANFFPTAFLPCGLDALGLLNPFVASQGVGFPSSLHLGSRAGLDSGAGARPDAFTSAVPMESEPALVQSINPTSLFKLHQGYLQETVATSIFWSNHTVDSVSSRSSVSHLRLSTQALEAENETDGDALIWDSV